MPHVIIKVYPGRTAAEKAELADRLAQLLHDTLDYNPDAVSVVVEEVDRDRWMEDVYEPDIRQRQPDLVRWPKYGPLSWVSPEERDAAARGLAQSTTGSPD